LSSKKLLAGSYLHFENMRIHTRTRTRTRTRTPHQNTRTLKPHKCETLAIRIFCGGVYVCCNVLQWVAVCRSVSQCVAVCCSVCCSVSQCAAVCCSVSQCVAVCCSVLQHVAVRSNKYNTAAFFFVRFMCYTSLIALQHAATHCNTLQHTATHCNTLQLGSVRFMCSTVPSQANTPTLDLH